LPGGFAHNPALVAALALAAGVICRTLARHLPAPGAGAPAARLLPLLQVGGKDRPVLIDEKTKFPTRTRVLRLMPDAKAGKARTWLIKQGWVQADEAARPEKSAEA
jgi:hypothetical protein